MYSCLGAGKGEVALCTHVMRPRDARSYFSSSQLELVGYQRKRCTNSACLWNMVARKYLTGVARIHSISERHTYLDEEEPSMITLD